MSNAQVSVGVNFRVRVAMLRRFLAISFPMFTIFPGAGEAAAATPGKSYFFATREACVVSGAFSKRECAAAFSNARAQFNDLAPSFSSSADCRLRFHLCEARRPEPLGGEALGYAETESVVFTPVALGVEMVATANGVEAAPTLAVETSAKLFPRVPVTKPDEAREKEPSQEEASGQDESGRSAILPADHFEPFSKRKPMDGAATFSAYALSAIDDETRRSASEETLEERRARVKNAPLIE